MNSGLEKRCRKLRAHSGFHESDIEVLAYPEEISELAVGDLQLRISRPEELMVVMGASGKASREVHLEALRALKVPLFKRRGGGGTVLLGPNTLVITLLAGVTHAFRNGSYFSAINRSLITVLENWCSADYRPRGISDIAVQGKKIVGCSIYRKKHILLYQGSMLVDVNVALMERLLKHPQRQPDYRHDRTHADFVTSLRQLGVAHSFSLMKDELERLLPSLISTEIGMIDPAFSKGME